MLKDRQKRFVEEYLIDLDPTAAYERAGYKSKGRTAQACAAKLLSNAIIQEAIQAARQKQATELQIDANRIIKEHAAIAFSDIGDILDFSADQPRLKAPKTIPEHARRAISSVKIKRSIEGSGDKAQEVEVIEFRLWPKEASLAKVAEYFPMPQPPREPTKIDMKVEHIGSNTTFNRFAAAFERMLADRPALLPPGNRDGESIHSVGSNGKAH